MNEEKNNKTLLEIAQSIIEARKDRPAHDEMAEAIRMTLFSLRQAEKLLEDIFNRENTYHLYEEVYQRRKSEFDKII